MKHALMIGGLLCVLVAGGCSNSPPLDTGSSAAAIHTAEADGADQTPRASLHLQLAREALDGALALAEKGETDQASSMLQRAEADAELALLLSRENTEILEAEQAMDRVRQLRSSYR